MELTQAVLTFSLQYLLLPVLIIPLGFVAKTVLTRSSRPQSEPSQSPNKGQPVRRYKVGKVGQGNVAVPVNTVAPVLSGTATQGQVLSVTNGTWTNTPTGYSYIWKADGVVISSGTNTYTLTASEVGKVITCLVGASNASGPGTAVPSNSLGPVAGLALPSIQFFSASIGQAEGSTGTTSYIYTLVRSGDTSGSSTVDWAVTGSGANPASSTDFSGGVLPSGTASFASGASSATFTVNVVGDTTVESDETFTVTLSNPVNATLGAQSTATGTITNDDSSGTTWGGAGDFAAPTLGYPTDLTNNPVSFSIDAPSAQTGDVLKLAYSSSSSISSPTILSHTITDADVAADSIDMGLSGITFTGTVYFQALLSVGGVDSANLSNIVAWGDASAPVITTSATQTVVETLPLSVALTGTGGAGIEHWELVAGTPDNLQFDIAGTTLEWFGNKTQLYNSPVDQGMDNAYVTGVRAVGYNGKATDLTLTVSVTQADLVPDTITVTPVTNATRDTDYIFDFGPITGVSAPPINIPCAISAGSYSLDGGTTWNAAGSFNRQLNQSFKVKLHSSASYSTGVNSIVSYGYTDSTGTTAKTATLTVTTEANPAVPGYTPSSTAVAASTQNFTNHTFNAIDFLDGYPVVVAGQTISSQPITGVTVNGIACTKVAQAGTTHDPAVWVCGTAVTAGNYDVVLTTAGFNNQWSLPMSGTLINTSTPTPTSTATLAYQVNSTPYATSSALTIPASGIGVAFELGNSALTPSSGTQIWASTDGLAQTVRNLTAGSWTPTFTGGNSKFIGIIAATWGA